MTTDAEALQIAARIKEKRLDHHLSVTDMAIALDLSTQNYISCESHFGLNRQKKYLNIIATVLNIHPDWIVTGVEPTTPFIPDPDVKSKIFYERQTVKQREALAKRMKARRYKLKMTTKHIAEQVGMNRVTYFSWEDILPARPIFELEAKIEALLKVPKGWLRDIDIKTPDIHLAKTDVVTEHLTAKTIAEEIRLVGCWLATENVYRRTSDYQQLKKPEKRTADIFATHYGVNGEAQVSLPALSAQYAITVERVKQILHKMIDRTKGLQVPMPCLDHITQDIKQHLPATIKELDAHYRALLGEHLSVISIDRFSREVLGKKMLDLTESNTDTDTQWDVVAFEPETHETELLRVTRDLALEMIRTCGAAQLYYVLGEASVVLKRGISEEEVLKSIRLMPGFEWLLHDHGWFWFGHEFPADNKVHHTVRKLLAVSPRKIDVEDIVQALMRSRRTANDHARLMQFSLEASFLVVIELLKRTPWVQTSHRHEFKLKTTLSVEEVLTDAELKVYRFLSGCHGVASRQSIAQALVTQADSEAEQGQMVEAGMDMITLYEVLVASPILYKLDAGVFCLRGWPLNANAVKLALETAAEAN